MKSQQQDNQHVSTEPQRRALEAMSADLVRKLNLMVAEQEARARDFAAHQHSLSSLPIQTQPQVQRFEQPKQNKRKYAQHTPPPPVAPSPAYTQQPLHTPDYSDYLPPVPKSTSPQYKQPTIIKGKKKKEDEGISATSIIVILLIVFFIMSKSCS